MKKISAILLAFSILLSTTVFAKETEYKNQFIVDYMDMLVEFVAENYKFGITEGELYETVMKQLLDENPQLFETILQKAFGSLDKHSQYFDVDEMQELMNSLQASICGIGVTVQERDGEIVVISPIENSPAKKAGIIANDVIVTVNGEENFPVSRVY